MSTELQERITRNVRILMAVQAIGDQKTLAARLSWGTDKLTRTLRGERRWAVADLQELADVFGLGPGDLLSDASALVTVAAPALTGTDHRSRTTPRYFGRKSGTVVPLSLVSASQAG